MMVMITLIIKMGWYNVGANKFFTHIKIYKNDVYTEFMHGDDHH